MDDRERRDGRGGDPERVPPRPPPRSPKPAGWYKDPSGKFDWRYFDGRWTDDVANEGDDQTYIDPVPSPGRQPQAAIQHVAPSKRRKRTILKLPLWVVAALGIIIVIAIASTAGDDEPDSATGTTMPVSDSPGSAGTADEPAVAQAAGDADEVDDVRSCTLVDSQTLTFDLINNSSETSSYIIDVNYLDGAGQRIADETLFVNHVRPDELAAEKNYVFNAGDAASCSVAEVERISAESPDDLGAVTCQVTGVDAIGDLTVGLTATNGSSKLSDYSISASLVRDGARIGTAIAVIENIPAGGSAPSDGLTTTDGPADGVACEVVHVQRTASE